jgi:hypothetical protein
MKDADDPYRNWDAAYVFGMLTSDERRAFERHLAECPTCTTAVAELAGLPGILAALSPDEAFALLDAGVSEDADAKASADAHLLGSNHQPELVQSLARSVRRRRSRVRSGIAALVVGVGAVLAVTGVLIGVGLGTPGASPAPLAEGTSTSSPEVGIGVVQAMSQVEPGRLDADLAITEKGWGTRFDWTCSYSDEWGPSSTPTTYDLVVTDASGAETSVASWSVTGDKAGNLSASTSIPTTTIRSVDIRVAGSSQPLVRSTL